jgi:hypothetical protein
MVLLAAPLPACGSVLGGRTAVVVVVVVVVSGCVVVWWSGCPGRRRTSG